MEILYKLLCADCGANNDLLMVKTKTGEGVLCKDCLSGDLHEEIDHKFDDDETDTWLDFDNFDLGDDKWNKE